MNLYLYNDLSCKKEVFKSIIPGEVRFYSCGPTVYDYFHVGNARPFILFDVLRRYLTHIGYKVTYIQNFTDIDDKMILRAQTEGITVSELADRFIAAYFEDADALGIKRADIHPRATEEIPAIINIIEKLIAGGHAYNVDGDVYFNIESFPPYGKLSGQSLDELQSGARVEVDERKRHPLDFSLWKKKKEGEPSWQSPWGEGRPGWHIECSAMSMRYLGESIDIHSGGCDLMFPHHENEIAQSESASGKPFATFWIHNGYLMIGKEKMGKSLGNFSTARELIKQYPSLAIRLFVLSAHYRSPLNFSHDGLEQAVQASLRLQNCVSGLDFAIKKRADTGEGNQKLRDHFTDHKELFYSCMNDDFNTAGALGAIFELVRSVNSALSEDDSFDKKLFTEIQAFFDVVHEIMGILPNAEKSFLISEEEVNHLIAERQRARAEKDFKKSDEIRDQLLGRGVILEDTAQGTRWKLK